MTSQIGMFEMTYRLICKVPDIIKWIFDLLGPLLDTGSMLGQILVLVFMAKVVAPVAFWLIDYGVDYFLKFLNLFEK